MADRHEVRIVPAARRQLEQLPRQVLARVREAIRGLGMDPRPQGSRMLSEARKIWRIRAGDYRVLYEIRDRELVVLVIRVGHRRDVYRRASRG